MKFISSGTRRKISAKITLITDETFLAKQQNVWVGGRSGKEGVIGRGGHL